MKRVLYILTLSVGIAASGAAGDVYAQDSTEIAARFCRTLERYVESANARFLDLEGRMDTPKEADGSGTFVAKEQLPGAQECIVYHEERPIGPWVDCEILVTDDPEAAKAVYAVQANRAGACLGRGWALDTGTRLDGRQVYSDWERIPGKPYVTVSNTKDKQVARWEVGLSVTVPDEEQKP